MLFRSTKTTKILPPENTHYTVCKLSVKCLSRNRSSFGLARTYTSLISAHPSKRALSLPYWLNQLHKLLPFTLLKNTGLHSLEKFLPLIDSLTTQTERLQSSQTSLCFSYSPSLKKSASTVIKKIMSGCKQPIKHTHTITPTHVHKAR